MLRRGLVVGLVGAVVASASVDLSACGDKFLRIGRTSRVGTYAAVHRSSILLVVPSTAKMSEVRDFEKALTKAGHRFQAAASMDALSRALAAGTVDILIVAAKDAPALRAHAMAATSRPEILPFAEKSNRAVLAMAQQQFGHVLRFPAYKHEALIEIDNLMEQRLRGVQVNALND